MIDLIKEIWQTMSSNKLRTALTGFSVAWGIFILLLLLGLAKGMVDQGMSMAERNDPNRITIWSGSTTLPYQGMPEGRRVQFHDRDFEAIQHSDQHVGSVTAQKYLRGTISSTTNYLKNATSTGVFPQYFNQQYKLLDGRPINDADIRDSRKSIVLHRKSAAELFGSEQGAVGKNVQVGQFTFTVVGVYDHDWEDIPLIPYTTAVALNGYNDRTDVLNVHLQNVTDTAQSKQVERSARAALAKTEKFDAADQGALWIFDRYEAYIKQQNGNVYLTYAMWVIGILTLLTGIVGVSNIMFVSVSERTHEIGIRRAIGAKPRKILSQIMIESVALTSVFGYIGIVMGTIATELIKHFFAGSQYDMIKPEVDINIAIEVAVALVIAGALAGLFPALRALKIKPVEALQEE